MPEILIFAKWRRKSYSVYSTIKKVVVISVLPVIYFLSAPVLVIASEQDSTGIKMKYDLEEIEVSARRSPALYSQIARIVTVVGSKEIEAAPVQNVQDLLEYVAGVDVRQRGAEGVQTDVSIRGGTFDQTIILLNGINISDPQTGHHNFNLPVSLNQIQRIEVLEGPAARVYGPNAFSGAINIVTKKPGSEKLSLNIGGGSHRYFNANASTGFFTGKLGHFLSAGRKSSSGYIENTDFAVSDAFYSSLLESEKGTFVFQLGYSEKGFGANSFYTPVYPNQYEQTKTYFSSAKWESTSALHFTPAIYWRRHRDKFELFRKEAPDWYTSHNYHRTDVFGANLNSWVQWSLGKTSLGAEWRSENILSNVLGEEIQSPVKVPGEDAFFTKSKSRNTTSLFLEHAYYRRGLTVTGGLMANHISENTTGLNVFPGIEISHQLFTGLKIYSSFNSSLRMPTFTDLYYSGPTNIGNPDLKPEKSASVEGGIKLNRQFIQGHLVVFYQNGKNIIDWVKMESGEIWQPRNLTRLKSFGTEFRIQFNLKDLAGNHFPEKISISYFNNNLEKISQDFISQYVLDNLKNKLVITVNQELSKNLLIYFGVTYQDREGTFTEYVSNNWGKEKQYAPFWLFDGKVSYKYKNISIFISANNIFDRKYYDVGNVIQPGRWLKTGISYKLDFN